MSESKSVPSSPPSSSPASLLAMASAAATTSARGVPSFIPPAPPGPGPGPAVDVVVVMVVKPKGEEGPAPSSVLMEEEARGESFWVQQDGYMRGFPVEFGTW